MQKTGVLKLKILCVEALKGDSQPCSLIIKANHAKANVQSHSTTNQMYQTCILPVADKIELEVHNNHQDIGYFELPLTKILSFPNKRHFITVNCITKDANEQTLNPETFAILKLSLRYLANQVIKFKIFIDKLMMDEEHHDIFQRQLFVECKLGDSCSQTKSQKVKEGLTYVWAEQLSFTIQEIPHKIQILIKDKDFVDDEMMGSLVIDPQREGFWSAKNNMQERRFQIVNGKRKIVVYLRKDFEMPKNQ